MKKSKQRKEVHIMQTVYGEIVWVGLSPFRIGKKTDHVQHRGHALDELSRQNIVVSEMGFLSILVQD